MIIAHFVRLLVVDVFWLREDTFVLNSFSAFTFYYKNIKFSIFSARGSMYFIDYPISLTTQP